MNRGLRDITDAPRLSLLRKHLSCCLLRFVSDHGIDRLLASLHVFGREDADMVLGRELGYRLNDRARLRMVGLLVDFLCECGSLKKKGDLYCWQDDNDCGAGLSYEETGHVKRFFKGQVDFFEECIGYADAFLKGAQCLYRFDDGAADVWREFLGDAEFGFARSVLAGLMFSGKGGDRNILDLCCGPGFDIAQIRGQFPDAKVTAVDFKGIFMPDALCGIPHPESVRMVGPGLWSGFGHPLPFRDESFDEVFFACADPYIPGNLREYVYRDVFRVLRRGGSVNILSRSYPDAGRKYVSDPWTRKAVLCHDFAESVCEGWHGFRDARESADFYRNIGYTVHTVMLDASVWRLDKP